MQLYAVLIKRYRFSSDIDEIFIALYILMDHFEPISVG